MKLVIAIVIALLLIVSLVTGTIYFPLNSPEAIVEIPQGAPAIVIAESLHNKGVIRNKLLFRLYIKAIGVEKYLSYGEFHFGENKSLKGVVDQLLEGRVKLHPVTIIEGLTISQTADQIANAGFIDRDRFSALCRDSLLAEELTGLQVGSLEGFLYPDTYMLPASVTEEYVIRTMVQKFFRKLSSIEIDHKDNENDSKSILDNYKYDMLKLASIIEKEATFSDEKPLISGVYHNRMRIGMRLQADPTVAYVLSKDDIFRSVILYRDLEIDSPYNTYRKKGLPPTPICSPSIASIEAAFHPEETDYLFFFANRYGRHIFSRTYRDHLQGLRALRSGS